MKINSFKPNELKRVVKNLEYKASILNKKEPLLKRIKQWILYFKGN